MVFNKESLEVINLLKYVKLEDVKWMFGTSDEKINNLQDKIIELSIKIIELEDRIKSLEND